MKKAVVIAALALLSEGANAATIYNTDGNKLDLYGSIRGRHYFSQKTSQDGDFTYMRFGFKGQTKINDAITGYGQWEYQAQANKAESEGNSSDRTRLGFAGLNFGRWGSIDYGRNYGVYYDLAAITDLAPIYDILTDSNVDNFLTGRGNNLLTYRNKNGFGLSDKVIVALQYQGANGVGENNSSRSAYAANGDGYGASLEWDVTDDFALLAAGASSKRTAQQNALALGDGQRADIWGVGFKYTPGAFYLAAKYAQASNMTLISGYGFANKTQNFEIYSQYSFANGIVPSLGYFVSKGQDIEGYGDVDLLKYVDASLRYYFNKNMSVYSDYRINLLDKNTPFGILTDDTVGLGITYQF
ncbi:porin [Candidatus Pantoea multigeneris]|uniref:Porin OmpC n=1 Tax=Candidatus Pantoea multigeneris TaxID=2608357 RepID=A0ABX0RBG8_9GAMM|nr:porin [Pantoea multigeneris]NIF22695.1 porin OmpC [Pantoea multigeneris]